MDTYDNLDTLQGLVNYLYRERESVTRLDVLTMAESFDLDTNLLEIVNLIPPGTYYRQGLCDQINSALVGHGWGFTVGTVE